MTIMTPRGYFRFRFAFFALLVTTAPAPKYAASQATDASNGIADDAGSERNEHGDSLEYIKDYGDRAEGSIAADYVADFSTSASGFDSKAWSCPSGLLKVNCVDRLVGKALAGQKGLIADETCFPLVGADGRGVGVVGTVSSRSNATDAQATFLALGFVESPAAMLLFRTQVERGDSSVRLIACKRGGGDGGGSGDWNAHSHSHSTTWEEEEPELELVAWSRPGWVGFAYLAAHVLSRHRDSAESAAGHSTSLPGFGAGRVSLITGRWLPGTVSLEVRFPWPAEVAAALGNDVVHGAAPTSGGSGAAGMLGPGTRSYLIGPELNSYTLGTFAHSGRVRVGKSDLSEVFHSRASWGLGTRPSILTLGDRLNIDTHPAAGGHSGVFVSAAAKAWSGSGRGSGSGSSSLTRSSPAAGALQAPLFGPMGGYGNAAAHFALDGVVAWPPASSSSSYIINSTSGGSGRSNRSRSYGNIHDFSSDEVQRVDKRDDKSNLGRCETAPGSEPWWQVKLREPSAVVEVAVVFAAPEGVHPPPVKEHSRGVSSASNAEATDSSVDSTGVPAISAATESARLMRLLDDWTPWVMLGAADSALFRLAPHEPAPPSTESPARSSLRSFRQSALKTQRFGMGTCSWLNSPSSSTRARSRSERSYTDGADFREYWSGNSTHERVQVPEHARGTYSDTVPLVECRWPLEEPARRVGFVRVQLGCKQCALRIAEVFIVGLPDSKLHPLFQQSALGTSKADNRQTNRMAATSDESGNARISGDALLHSASNENIVECDWEAFNRCPGSANLVACLHSSTTDKDLSGSTCRCFTRALECFHGDQKACPGRPSIDGAAKAKGCTTIRASSVDARTNDIDGGSEVHGHEEQ